MAAAYFALFTVTTSVRIRILGAIVSDGVGKGRSGITACSNRILAAAFVFTGFERGVRAEEVSAAYVALPSRAARLARRYVAA